MPIESQWGMKPNLPLAKQLAKRDVPALVYDAVNLEGVAMTLPEVQTILDGITVGGHRISDQNMAMNQAKTWERIFELVDTNAFAFNKDTALLLHSIAGEEEYEPPAPQDLDETWQEVQTLVESQDDIYDRATTAFLQMARNQFFWDVNKRTGRFMMNGILLAAGFPIINVPVKRQQEFYTLMLEFYSSNDMQPMNRFLRSCVDSKTIKNFQLDLKFSS